MQSLSLLFLPSHFSELATLQRKPIKKKEDMQTSGVSELQQYVVGRPHIFKLSPELPPPPSTLPSSAVHHLPYSPHTIHHAQQQLQSHLHHALHHAHYHHAQPQSTTQQQPLLQAQQQQQQQQPSRQLGDHESSRAMVMVAEEINEEVTEEEGERGIILSAGNRWPRQETLALLKIRSDMDAIFRDSSLKGPLWEEVSRKLAEAGYNRSGKKCKEKFENVHKYYKRTKDSKNAKHDGKIYRFHNQLEALYGKANMLSNEAANNTLPSVPPPPNAAALTTPQNGDKMGFFLSRDNISPSVERTQNLHYNSDVNLSSGSGSEGDCEDPFKTPNSDSRKRKRKHGDPFVQFMETLMHRVLEKQEQMQQKFLEALEKREHERMVREEAWRRQEMSRMTREHEVRAQERAFAAARDAALIAFLQKVSGQTFDMPQIAIAPQSLGPAPEFVEEQSHEKDHHLFDPHSKRWPKSEVHALIKFRTGLDARFQEPGPKASLWEEISSRMCSLGFNRNAKRCKEKWENINKYFKKAKESNKIRPENSKTCPYFHELDDLYSKGLLGQKQLGYIKVDDHSEEFMEQRSESNREEDSGHAHAGGDSDQILAITAFGENGNSRSNTSNAGTHTFSCSKDGNNDDQGLISKIMHNVIEFSTTRNAPPAISKMYEENNMEKASISGKPKPMMPDLEEKQINMQASDHVKLVHAQALSEDYEKMEVGKNGREEQVAQEKQQLQYMNGSAPSSTFIGLVERFSSGAPDFRISIPANVE